MARKRVSFFMREWDICESLSSILSVQSPKGWRPPFLSSAASVHRTKSALLFVPIRKSALLFVPVTQSALLFGPVSPKGRHNRHFQPAAGKSEMGRNFFPSHGRNSQYGPRGVGLAQPGSYRVPAAELRVRGARVELRRLWPSNPPFAEGAS